MTKELGHPSGGRRLRRSKTQNDARAVGQSDLLLLNFGTAYAGRSECQMHLLPHDLTLNLNHPAAIFLKTSPKGEELTGWQVTGVRAIGGDKSFHGLLKFIPTQCF